MSLEVIGLNHKTATVNQREEALALFAGLPGVLLATCNRVEIYAIKQLNDYSINNCGFYHFRGEEGVRHLFRVASGLDSQILGEREILGQVKKAYLGSGFDNGFLRVLFEAAIEVGKKVREETGISKGNVSLASVAVNKGMGLLCGEENKKALLLGSGKIAESVLKNVLKRNFAFVWVANRTYQRAKTLAERIGGIAVKFDRLKKELTEADLVISSTAAPHAVLKAGSVEKRDKPLVVIDLAVPRDVDPGVAEIPGVTLLNIDDIREEINLNLLKRKLAAIEAEEIVEREVRKFCARYALEPAAAA